MNESGPLGEAGARLRALVAQIQEWEDDDSRGYDEAIDVLIKIKAELDAVLSAPVVDVTNHHNALACPYCNPKRLVLSAPVVGQNSAAGNQWGVVTQEGEEPCP